MRHLGLGEWVWLLVAVMLRTEKKDGDYHGGRYHSLFFQTSVLSFFLTQPCHRPFPHLHISTLLLRLCRAWAPHSSKSWESHCFPWCMWRWETSWHHKMNFTVFLWSGNIVVGYVIIYQIIIILGIVWDTFIFMCWPAYLMTIFIFVSMENLRFWKVFGRSAMFEALC